MSDQRAVRVGDFIASRCNKVPPGSVTFASMDTFTNNRPQVRLGDVSIPGPGAVVSGSSSTFVNNRPACRVQDKVTCGKITNGSMNTFIK